ncbi:MAG: hypothetical protein HQL29_00015 [Candidatus Omnitrophica bacterium]|nr:hypothetical protein [Candidatus Omnitrophota bacterium]
MQSLKKYMKIFSLIFIFFTSFYVHQIIAVSQNVEDTKMPREIMLKRLNAVFTYRIDIRDTIKDLEIIDNKKNSPTFKYNGKPIEEMNDESLQTLTNQVNQTISEKNIKRLQQTQRQLKKLK